MERSKLLFEGQIGAMFCGIGLYVEMGSLGRSPKAGIGPAAEGVPGVAEDALLALFLLPKNWVTASCTNMKTAMP